MRVANPRQLRLRASKVSHVDGVACGRLAPSNDVEGLDLSSDLTASLQIEWIGSERVIRDCAGGGVTIASSPFMRLAVSTSNFEFVAFDYAASYRLMPVELDAARLGQGTDRRHGAKLLHANWKRITCKTAAA